MIFLITFDQAAHGQPYVSHGQLAMRTTDRPTSEKSLYAYNVYLIHDSGSMSWYWSITNRDIFMLTPSIFIDAKRGGKFEEKFCLGLYCIYLGGNSVLKYWSQLAYFLIVILSVIDFYFIWYLFEGEYVYEWLWLLTFLNISGLSWSRKRDC